MSANLLLRGDAKITGKLDMSKKEIINAVYENLASAPSSPVTGQYYYDTVLKQVGFYNGTAWNYFPESNWWVYWDIPQDLISKPALPKTYQYPADLPGLAGKSIPFTGRYRFDIFINYGLYTMAGDNLTTTLDVDSLLVQERNPANTQVFRKVAMSDYYRPEVPPTTGWYSISFQANGTVRLNAGDQFAIKFITNQLTALGLKIMAGSWVELTYLGDFTQGAL